MSARYHIAAAELEAAGGATTLAGAGFVACGGRRRRRGWGRRLGGSAILGHLRADLRLALRAQELLGLLAGVGGA